MVYIKENIEKFYYNKIIKPIIYQSTLGRMCINGNSDKGITFEYMYENRPSGYSNLGKLVDKILLNKPAVKATRNRKNNIRDFVKKEVIEHKNKPLVILDVASGPSRYLREAAIDLKGGFYAYCIDNNNEEIEFGRKLAKEKNIDNLFFFENIDVLDSNQLSNLSINPNLVIVSGLYVYLNDETVRKSINDISNLLNQNSKILIDNQIKNHSKKMMEYILKTTKGTPWKINYRTKEEMQKLIEPNFKIIQNEVDSWGMYNIIIGIKR